MPRQMNGVEVRVGGWVRGVCVGVVVVLSVGSGGSVAVGEEPSVGSVVGEGSLAGSVVGVPGGGELTGPAGAVRVPAVVESATLRPQEGERGTLGVEVDLRSGRVSLPDLEVVVGDYLVEFEEPLAASGIGYGLQQIDLGAVDISGLSSALPGGTTLAGLVGESVVVPVLGQYHVVQGWHDQRVRVAPLPVTLIGRELQVPGGLVDRLLSRASVLLREPVLSLEVPIEDIPVRGRLAACETFPVCGPGEALSPDVLPVRFDEFDAASLANSYETTAALQVVRASGSDDVPGAVDECIEKFELYGIINLNAVQYYCLLALSSGVDGHLGGSGEFQRVGDALAECAQHKNEVWCEPALRTARMYVMDQALESTLSLAYATVLEPTSREWLPVSVPLLAPEMVGVEYPDDYPIYILVHSVLDQADLDLSDLPDLDLPISLCVEQVPCSLSLSEGTLTPQTTNTRAHCVTRDGTLSSDSSKCHQVVSVSAHAMRTGGSATRPHYLFGGSMVASFMLSNGGSPNAVGFGVQYDTSEMAGGWTFANNDPNRDRFAFRGYRREVMTPDGALADPTARPCVLTPTMELDLEWSYAVQTGTHLSGFAYRRGEQYVQRDLQGGYCSRHSYLSTQYVDAILRPQAANTLGPGSQFMDAGYIHNRRTWTFSFGCGLGWQAGVGANGSGAGAGVTAGYSCSVTPEPQNEAVLFPPTYATY
jgi:hypothetical protein